MDVLILTVFVSLLLVAGALSLFIGRLRDGDFEHGDRLSLMPLEDDTEAEGLPNGEARTIEPRNENSAGSGESHGSQ